MSTALVTRISYIETSYPPPNVRDVKRVFSKTQPEEATPALAYTDKSVVIGAATNRRLFWMINKRWVGVEVICWGVQGLTLERAESCHRCCLLT